VAVCSGDILSVELSQSHMELAGLEAEKLLRLREAAGAPAGGVSRIRSGEDREKKLLRDAVVGQIGTLAMSLYWTGGVAEYLKGREETNRTPRRGDNGLDIGSCDVKSSILRPNRYISDYHLLVRPAEWHADVWYARALMREDRLDVVYLCGWLNAADVKRLSENITHDDAIFGDAYKVPIIELHPLPPMKWRVS
jgi:hypothetical protein